ncbi:hypothetical protein [Bacillus ndiopicus]|uniref:hypothetical protein n=1 Tax=Bacillus ndiopicus TaxID=1347368 RepID=UPI0005A7DEF9|nr:hypothetical protein [Bacillus ndiopicus]
MLKLDIFKNINGFLRAVNECEGPVHLLRADGGKENINKQYGIQNELVKKYMENKNCLRVSLDIPKPKDYLSIVSYYIGE